MGFFSDLVSYGRLFLADPDLPRRLAAAGPFNTADTATFYGRDSTGYTDYPAPSDQWLTGLPPVGPVG